MEWKIEGNFLKKNFNGDILDVMELKTIKYNSWVLIQNLFIYIYLHKIFIKNYS